MKNYDEKTKETTELVIFTVQMAVAIDKATKNGLQWTDIAYLLPVVPQMPQAIDGIEKVPSELRNMDDSQRLEMSTEIQKVDFDCEISEEIVEQALRVGIEQVRLITLIREARQKS